jgi:hypothetical protein
MIWQEKVDPNLIDPDMLEVRAEIEFLKILLGNSDYHIVINKSSVRSLLFFIYYTKQ